MRRRRSTVILLSVGLALSAPVSHATLEQDCYFQGGYFASTYVGAGYFDETCSPGDPPSPVSDSNDRKNLFRFPGMWN